MKKTPNILPLLYVFHPFEAKLLSVPVEANQFWCQDVILTYLELNIGLGYFSRISFLWHSAQYEVRSRRDRNTLIAGTVVIVSPVNMLSKEFN